MTEFLMRLLKDPLGFIKRVIFKTIIFPVKYGKESGYDAENYWGDRFRNHRMSLKAVGCEGLSEEDNLRARERAIAVFDTVCRDQNIQFGTVNILEIGCGNGFYTNYFRKNGARNYTGIDITDVLFTQLQAKFPGYHFLQRDVTAGRIEGQHDLVVMMDVIQHIVNRQKLLSALENVRGCLRPNGIFIVAPLAVSSKRHLFHVHRWSVNELSGVFREDYSKKIIPFREGEELAVIRSNKIG